MGLGRGLGLLHQQSDVMSVRLPCGEGITVQYKWKEGDQIGGCCSSLDKKVEGAWTWEVGSGDGQKWVNSSFIEQVETTG